MKCFSFLFCFYSEDHWKSLIPCFCMHQEMSRMHRSNRWKPTLILLLMRWIGKGYFIILFILEILMRLWIDKIWGFFELQSSQNCSFWHSWEGESYSRSISHPQGWCKHREPGSRAEATGINTVNFLQQWRFETFYGSNWSTPTPF